MSQSIIKGHQRRRLGQESRDRDWRSHGRMFTLHHLPAFLYNPEPLALRWYHLQWAGPPTSIISQENAMLTCLHSASLMEAFPQLEFPLPGWLYFVPNWQTLISTSPGCNKVLELSKFITPLVAMTFFFLQCFQIRGGGMLVLFPKQLSPKKWNKTKKSVLFKISDRYHWVSCHSSGFTVVSWDT